MRWSILKAATEFGVSRETVRKGLAAAGVKVVAKRKGDAFTTRQIAAAIFGDLDREKTLETRERRKALERENAEADGKTLTIESVQALYGEALLPVRQRLLALPNEAATRVNPTDPEHARAQLQAWVDESLPLIREQLPKPAKGTK